MEIDYLTTEGELTYRVISSYADYRASGWPKQEEIGTIVDKLKTVR